MRRLEAKGWVERVGRQGRAKGLDEAATVDGRVVRVTITAQGARLMERLPALAQAVNRRAARGVAADELAELKRLLALIISNMERE